MCVVHRTTENLHSPRQKHFCQAEENSDDGEWREHEDAVWNVVNHNIIASLRL